MPVLALLGLLLSGSAQAAAVSGRVTDQATGRPVPRMVVTAMASDVKTSGETITDEEGRYEIAGLQPGAYAIGVWHGQLAGPIAACKTSFRSSGVKTIGFAFILLACAAFSTIFGI